MNNKGTSNEELEGDKQMAQVKFLIGDLKDLHKLDKEDEERSVESDKDKSDIDVSNLKAVPQRVIDLDE